MINHTRCHEHTKPFLYKEVERLCQLGVFKKVNRSEWGALTSIQPKNNGKVKCLSNFRKLNQRIRRKPFPTPKIQYIILNLEGFTYASSLDLNMRYYHIELSPGAKQICTIVLPWGKYEYQNLPMGVCNIPNIFQKKTSKLFDGLDMVCAYIDGVLIIAKNNF